jgi:uncharacterized protein (DUF1684 family)
MVSVTDCPSPTLTRGAITPFAPAFSAKTTIDVPAGYRTVDVIPQSDLPGAPLARSRRARPNDRYTVSMMPTRWATACLLMGAATALVGASDVSRRQGARGSAAEPEAAILAAHAASDASYKKAALSPFTAVAVQYFQPGQTIRLAVGPAGPAFGPSAVGSTQVDLTLEDGAFAVAAATGAAVHIASTGGGGEVVGLPGIPLTGRRRLAQRQVLAMGRYFVETVTAVGNGNARVFDPESPARKAFTGLRWFPPRPALQVKARFVANPAPTSVTITTSRGLQREYFRVGAFEFTVDGQALRLTALATVAAPKQGDELFVAFRDATTGQETYEVGRYLFIPFVGADASYLLDFNLATNPLCNYSPHYNCPIPLRENTLPVAIRAGEMTYPAPRH